MSVLQSFVQTAQKRLWQNADKGGKGNQLWNDLCVKIINIHETFSSLENRLWRDKNKLTQTNKQKKQTPEEI